MSVPYDSYDYQKYWEKREYENVCERVALKYLFKKIDRKDSLVDIGGGFGRLTSIYAPLFSQSTIIDPSSNLLQIAKRNLRKYPNVSFVEGSLPKLPFEDETFDVALMIRVIHHVTDSESAIKEAGRIIKRKGYLILETANKIHFMARLKAIFSGNVSYLNDLEPQEKRSPESIREKKIIFVNHHPKKIINDLNKNGFLVKEILSVSNLRSPLIKKVLPLRLSIFLEKKLQIPLAKSFFGPSIFILSQKV